MTSPPENSVHVGLEELVRIIAEQVAGLETHKHQWAIIGASSPDPTGPVHPRMTQPDSNVTNVLLKCHCGEPRTITLDGRWGLSQLIITVGEQVNASSSEARSTTGEQARDKDDQPSGEYPPS